MEKTNEDKNNNLPTIVDDKRMLKINSPLAGRITDKITRAGKIVGSTALFITGLGITTISGIPAAVTGAALAIGSLARFSQNVTLKTEPTLLFGSKKAKDEILIFQDTMNPSLMSRMNGFDNLEKGAMMGMQTLVGLSRYKDNLRDTKKYTIDENGQKIYDQKFSTLTHSINLQNIKFLADLGYIKLDEMTTDFKGKTLDEKLLAARAKNGVVRSYLISEKLGFGNLKGAKDAVRAMFSKNENEKEKNSEVIQKISFRLTDKPIDFDELLSFTDHKVRELHSDKPKEVQRAIKRMASMMKLMNGRKISIGKDSFGRDVIIYPSRAENERINAQKRETKRNLALSRGQNKEQKETQRNEKAISDNGEKYNAFEKELQDMADGVNPKINLGRNQEGKTLEEKSQTLNKSDDSLTL